MIPILFIGLLALWLWKPAEMVAAKVGALPDEEIYPNQGDVLTMALEENTPSKTITDSFSSRGYWIAPMMGPDRILGAVRLRKFSVLRSANVAMPRRLGRGIVVYSVGRM